MSRRADAALGREVGLAIKAAVARVPRQPGVWAVDQIVGAAIATPNGIVNAPILRLFVDGSSRKILEYAPIHPDDGTYGMYLSPGQVVLP